MTGVDSSPEMIAYATRTYASKQYQTFLSLVLMHVPLILIKNLICVFKCHTALVDNHQAFLNGASRHCVVVA